MKLAIVDDNSTWREKIRKQIEACYRVNKPEIVMFRSGDDLIRSRRFFEAVFLDVEMEGRDGFDTALAYGDIFPNSYIMILTLHAELSRKGYLVNAFRYIDKTYMEEEIPEALDALGLLADQGRELEIRVFNEGMTGIEELEIICAETVPHGTLIHTEKRDYRAAINIGELERILDEGSFFRSHNSWIVNWGQVSEIQGNDVIMKNGTRAMVSRKQMAEAKRRFWEYKFRRARG